MNVMVYNEEYHMLVNIIKQSESPEEFEERWAAIMENTVLVDNEWLCTMYDIRSRWVPAYLKHIFSAEMSSSQRSESGHSFFKRYVSRKNSLMDFIIRFNMALRHQRHEELVSNHIDISEQPRLTSKFQMENQMVHIYTKKIFLLFQTEIDQSHFYICTKRSTTIDSKVYGVEHAHCTFIMREFESLHLRVKEIDDADNIGSSRNKITNREENHTIQDPSTVRAKGCGKRLKLLKKNQLQKGTYNVVYAANMDTTKGRVLNSMNADRWYCAKWAVENWVRRQRGCYRERDDRREISPARYLSVAAVVLLGQREGDTAKKWG
ncbi:Protein FAR1-RELATED SEQUENCE 5 [Abeliophyllum distichum]|uniref:Protein FAR1-RELATED SEQUENCE n=1 Tax=Abeliophyllum distichum TaxID=126358 RepID=A0ABD1RCV2_9LAMI